ncbi:MAG: hypothetical protein LIO70_10290 [Clostridiales bacterium]|nr:hypothetical protein [Clostridiales bacterium]
MIFEENCQKIHIKQRKQAEQKQNSRDFFAAAGMTACPLSKNHKNEGRITLIGNKFASGYPQKAQRGGAKTNKQNACRTPWGVGKRSVLHNSGM